MLSIKFNSHWIWNIPSTNRSSTHRQEKQVKPYEISWNHYFSWTLSRSVWSLVQRSTINCSEVKIQNTRFDESDGPVAKIVKGWKKMFLCWCQQKFAMRGGRQRSRGRCTCRCSHSEIARQKKTHVPLFWKACYAPRENSDFLSLTHTHTDCQTRFFSSTTRAYTIFSY